jgi:hypothetical protein
MHLLKVENSFQIKGRGLVVIPLLPPPTTRSFKPFRQTVRVERPDGARLELEALFALEHFSLIGRHFKWVTIVMFPAVSKQNLPVVSRILVDAETLAALPLKE